MRDHGRYEQLIRHAQRMEPLTTAVVYPTQASSLAGAMQAAEAGLMVPILIGPEAAISAAADRGGFDISGLEVVDAADEPSAAAAGVARVRDGSAGLLMKGSLHTASLLGAVVPRATGLRTDRRISHVFALDVPSYPKPLFVTDAVVNISPTLEHKVDICRNAIELVRLVGVASPKVAILSAVETVEATIPSTQDGAALRAMAEAGDFAGAVVDGPLALDDAISPDAVVTKHIDSRVAGEADILVVPNLESGNILYKAMTYLADADAAGVVLGAQVPIILASRADTVRTRIASAALGSAVGSPRPGPGLTPAQDGSGRNRPDPERTLRRGWDRRAGRTGRWPPSAGRGPASPAPSGRRTRRLARTGRGGSSRCGPGSRARPAWPRARGRSREARLRSGPQ